LSIERRLPYEEAVRNPLLLRYPPLAAAGSEIEGLTLSIDIAPTVLAVGGAPIGSQIQGRSLIPLLAGEPSEWRRSALIEFYTHENPMPWLMDMDYRAVRTERYKYIHWVRHPGLDELYDLETDPYELRNLIDAPEMAELRGDLRAELERLVLDALGLGGK
jgi:N-acetylglucosamine-6-sulfatase